MRRFVVRVAREVCNIETAEFEFEAEDEQGAILQAEREIAARESKYFKLSGEVRDNFDAYEAEQ